MLSSLVCVVSLWSLLLQPCLAFTTPRIITPKSFLSHQQRTTTTTCQPRYPHSKRDGPCILHGVFSDSEEDEGDQDPDRLSDEELEASMGEWDDKIARFNTVHLTGRIGNDPEPRYLEDGKVVVNLSLATKRKYHSMERKYRDLQWGDEETDWYGLEIWGQTAEFVSKFIDKGTRVGVIGSLQIDQWTDRETGELRSKAKIVVRDIDILETRVESDARRAKSGGSSFYGGGSSSSGSAAGVDDDWPSPAGSGSFF